MIANLIRGAKTATLHLPADRFQVAGVRHIMPLVDLPAQKRYNDNDTEFIVSVPEEHL